MWFYLVLYDNFTILASDIGEVENATVSGATVVNGKFILKRGTTVGITIDFHASKLICSKNLFYVLIF